MEFITSRFAPSPSGYLHLGHAYSALMAARFSDRLILRIEDIDVGRCREEFVEAIYEDLSWLGLTWEKPVRIQSEHFNFYQEKLSELEKQGLVYPCFCTRKDIQREIENATHAPHGPDGVLYPQTCKHLSFDEVETRKAAGQSFALRLHMDRALEMVGALEWDDLEKGKQNAMPEIFGDIVLARKDVPTSYHLSVCLDDDLQGIDRIVRGQDLFEATHVHRLLQKLLKLKTPKYHHHGLILGSDGRRLAKRDQAMTLRQMRNEGISVQDILDRLGMAS